MCLNLARVWNKQSIMMETYNPEIVSQYLNGAATEGIPMMKLMAQVVVILVIGLVLWRISSAFNRKKNVQRQTMFNDSRFQKHWRK
jgi:hypothetical protein